MRKSESERLLQELRKLNKKMNQATPDAISVRKFRDLFIELDNLLKSGAVFPSSWITRLNFTQLPTETTHSITDFDPPHEEQLRRRGLAWCQHPFVAATEYCNNAQCGNYIHARNLKPNLPKE